MVKARRIILVVVLLFPVVLHSQVIEKYATEINYNHGTSILRFRPFDNTGGIQRIDIVTGTKLGPIIIGSYWKADLEGNSWTGLLLEFGGKKNNLKYKIETRFFNAITKGTVNQIYAIPSIHYQLRSLPVGFGYCGFSVFRKGSIPFASLGPLITVNMGKNKTFLFSYLWDIYSEKRLFLFKIKYKI